MALEITGSLVKKLPVQSGKSARGEWKKQEFVVKTNDTYPKDVCFNVWGEDKVGELSSYNEGDNIKVSFNVESREYNEKWYTDLRAWKIEKEGAASISEQTPPQMPDSSLPEDIGEDDLPF